MKRSRLAPKSIPIDLGRMTSAMMTYLRDCSYVSSMTSVVAGKFEIFATDGSKWKVNIRRAK